MGSLSLPFWFGRQELPSACATEQARETPTKNGGKHGDSYIGILEQCVSR